MGSYRWSNFSFYGRCIRVKYSTLVDTLRDVFESEPSSLWAFHTDIGRLGLVGEPKTKNEALAVYLRAIVETAEQRLLLFPTFNYDFCRTGIYDVLEDTCQVGQLNEYVRGCFPYQRTQTPVFNFCVLGDTQFSMTAAVNPFSSESTFGHLVARQAGVVLFGAGLSSNTFIHHVEEMADVGYRYIKPFPGEILYDGERYRITLKYRVRPLMSGAVEYDFERLYSDLLARGILRRYRLGHGWVHFYRADELFEYWLLQLNTDELFLLTGSSRIKTRNIYDRYGYPLKWEVMEPE